MATIIIDEKSTGAKKMVEYLKTLPYAKIIEDKEPSAKLAKSIKEERTGKVTITKNTSDLLEMLKKQKENYSFRHRFPL